MRESKIEAELGRAAARLGVGYHKWGTQGYPDRVAMHGGQVLFLEIKQTQGTVSPLQKERIEAFAGHGVEVVIVRSVSEGAALLQTLAGGGR